jgi:alpha-amylase
LCQAFNWESNKQKWWSKLEEKVTDMAESGFTSAWLPPPTQSLSREGKLVNTLSCTMHISDSRGLTCSFAGYLPQNLYCLDSCYGSMSELKSLLYKMNEHNIRAMADVVINHRIGTTQGSNGMYNRYDGIPISWDEHAVTSCSGGMVI